MFDSHSSINDSGENFLMTRSTTAKLIREPVSILLLYELSGILIDTQAILLPSFLCLSLNVKASCFVSRKMSSLFPLPGTFGSYSKT